MNVHILVTCRNTALERASTLVFDTVRVGFPSANITLWDNHTGKDFVKEASDKISGVYKHTVETGTVFQLSHWQWIRYLVDEHQASPFVILDTDVIFYGNMEDEMCRLRDVGTHLAGEAIPTFFDPITKKQHMERFHTALMLINPVELLKVEQLDNAKRPPTVARTDLISPFSIAFRGSRTYYDTMANAFHAMQMRNCISTSSFVHLHCGSWLDYVHLINEDIGNNLRKHHEKVIANPEVNGPAYRELLQKFYATQQIVPA